MNNKRYDNWKSKESGYSGFRVISSRAPLNVLVPQEESEKYIHIQKEIEADEYNDLALCEMSIRKFMSGIKIGSQGEYMIISEIVKEELEEEMKERQQMDHRAHHNKSTNNDKIAKGKRTLSMIKNKRSIGNNIVSSNTYYHNNKETDAVDYKDLF